jgi:regulatory protein
MKITKLEYGKKNKKRVNVFVNGEYSFSLTISQVADTSIFQGQEIDQQELAELQSISLKGKVEERVMGFITTRPRSAREVRAYLQAKLNITEDEIAEIISLLERKGYINDREFSRWWIENRTRFKSYGLRKISAELTKKGVSREIINESIKAIDEQQKQLMAENLAKLAAKYVKKHAGLDKTEIKQKLYNYLAGRGYNYEEIKVISEQIF